MENYFSPTCKKLGGRSLDMVGLHHKVVNSSSFFYLTVSQSLACSMDLMVEMGAQTQFIIATFQPAIKTED
jgi:hypothetical protein